ncbi:MAG: hypothetical protein H7Y09_14795 [Chitinophagaceae bacterium]|nr:hypothetical protein [Anaerolineae bacterium]
MQPQGQNAIIHRIVHIPSLFTTGLTSWLALLMLSLGSIHAQEILIGGEARVIAMQANQPILLAYQGTAGETIAVTVRSLEAIGTIDTVLEIRFSDRRLAYNDNQQTERNDLAASDSAIVDLTLSESGEYLIRLDSYGSIGVGQVEVLLELVDPFKVDTQEQDDVLTLTVFLPRLQRYEYSLTAQQGEVLTITAHDLSHTLDPILQVNDSSGEVVAFNDDHADNDPTLDVFDARIVDFVIPTDGIYHVIVHDFLGNMGRFRLTISQGTVSASN